jgi:hypothetical protein
MQRVLAQKGSSAARSHTHGKSTLSVIENEPVLAAIFGGQLLDFTLRELHDSPLVPGYAAGARTHSGPRRMTLRVGP